MKAATERKTIRWFHILASIPIIGHIYGQIPIEVIHAGRWVILPLVILSGFWLWLGHHLKKRLRKTKPKPSKIAFTKPC